MEADNPVVEPVNTDAEDVSETSSEELLYEDVEDSLDSEEPGTESEEPDLHEDEIEGVKLKGTKEQIEKFRNERLMQADYTRKTQEVAEERKAVHAQREEMGKQVQFQQQHFAECAQAYTLSEQIKQYEAIDFNALFQQDADQARNLDWQRNQLVKQRDEILSRISQRSQQQALQEQQETAKRLQEGQAFLEREIKGWSKELAESLVGHGQTLGFSESELRQVVDPRHIKVLHKAYLYDQLAKRQAEKPKAATQEKPITRISASKGKATKDPSQMSPEEFAKWRSWHRSRRSA